MRVFKMKRTLPGAVMLSLCSCAHLPQSVGEASMFYRDYVGPVDDPTAALVRISAYGAVRVTPGSECADFSKPETGVALFSSFSLKDYGHLHNRKLGVAGEAPAGLVSTEIALKANQAAVISYTSNWTDRGMAYTCQVHRRFVPDAKTQYQFTAQPIYADGQCQVQIARLDDPPLPVPMAVAGLCGS